MSWFIKYLGALLLVLVTFSVCNGQDFQELKDPKAGKIELRLGPPPALNERSVLEDLENLKPDYTRQEDVLLSEICPKEPAPGEIRIKYDGLQRVVVSRILSYCNRLWSNSIDDRFYKGNESFLDHQKSMSDRCDMEAAFQQGRWWERSWRQSLPEEKGGAGQPKTVTIGRELTVFELGELRVTNTGQIKLGAFFFYIRSAEVDPKTQTINSVGSALSQNKEVKINQCVDFTIKPRITIKGSLVPEEIVSNASVELKFRFYSKYRKDPIAALTVNTESQPFQGVGSVQVYLELFCW